MKGTYCFVFTVFIIFLISFLTSAQWNPTNGPYGGKINCVASTGKRLLAGTNSGLYYSTNNGESWQIDTAVCPIDYILRGYYNLEVIDSIVVVVSDKDFVPRFSTDYGVTWHPGLVTGSSSSYPPIFDIKDNILAFILQPTSIFIDTFSINDNYMEKDVIGSRFFHYVENMPGDTILQCLTFSGDNILLGTSVGLFMTADSGKTWIKSDSGITRKNVTALKANDNYTFAGTDSGGVFRSDNNGETWVQMNSGLTTLSIKTFGIKGNNIYAGTKGGGVFLSTDNGDNWTPINTGLTNLNINSITFDGDQVLVGTDGSGVFTYNNSWTPINEGLSATEITSFIKKDNNLYAGTKGGGVFLSTDNGYNWINRSSGLTNLDVQALTAKGNNLFAGTNGGGIYRSEDDGNTWRTVNSGIFQKYIYSLAANDNYLFAGTNLPPNYPPNTGIYYPWPDSILIYRSSDDGNNWSVVSDTGAYLIPFIFSIDNNIFTAPWRRLLRSTDNGTTWSLSDSGLAFSLMPGIPYAFATNGNKLFAGTYNNGIYVSTNMGVSWSHVNNNKLQRVTAFTTSNNNIFAYNSSYSSNSSNISLGVYFSQDNGTSWNILEDSINERNTQGFFAPEINAMNVNNNYLFIGTKNRGVWKYPIENLVSVQEKTNNQPNNYELFQNYPNPFNPNTKIQYSIPKESFVTIKVYDILGKEITTLVNERKAIGNYSFNFNANNLPSGVYFYRMQAIPEGRQTGSFVSTKKFVLLK